MTQRPSIPHDAATLFQRPDGYGYDLAVAIDRWEWSPDHGRFGAYVTFADGWYGFTYPRPYNNPPISGPSLYWSCSECDAVFVAHDADNFYGNGPRCPMCSSGELDPAPPPASHSDQDIDNRNADITYDTSDAAARYLIRGYFTGDGQHWFRVYDHQIGDFLPGFHREPADAEAEARRNPEPAGDCGRGCRLDGYQSCTCPPPDEPSEEECHRAWNAVTAYERGETDGLSSEVTSTYLQCEQRTSTEPAQVVTPTGVQYLLPGESPPPAKKGADTYQQRFF